MTTIVERRADDPQAVLIICDYSPPRGADPVLLDGLQTLNADWISVAYNPGKATRVNSAIAARWIKDNAGRDVVFTLATRDMNRLAVESMLLGAQLLGLENVVAVQGDPFSTKELDTVQAVNDFTPTSLLRAITAMNEGVDYRGSKLQSSTAFCAGATLDLARDQGAELALMHRKLEAGARFLLTQPLYDPATLDSFVGRYEREHGAMNAPIFAGVQVLTTDSLRFADVPQRVNAELDGGRPGEEIAVETLRRFVDAGFRSIYLVPPILRGGRRDYAAAARVIDSFRAR